MTGVPPYPIILKNETWQQQKGVIAKVLKKPTGIGPALVRLRMLYGTVEWQYFDPHVAGPMPKPRTIEDLEERQAASDGKRNQIRSLHAEIIKVRDLCQDLGDKWERSSVIPKSTRVYVQRTMTQACQDFADDLDDIGTAGYDLVRAEIERVEQMANEGVKRWVKIVDTAIPKVKAKPTVRDYHDLMHDNMRGLGTSISKISKYKPLYKADWEDMVIDDFMDGVKDGAPVKAKVAKVEAALKRLKTAMKKS